MNEIQNNPVYKQVLAESFGGIMYNVANRNKYDSAQVLQLWDNLSKQEQSAAGGIMKGAINSLKGD
jgi:hypothetical protein